MIKCRVCKTWVGQKNERFAELIWTSKDHNKNFFKSVTKYGLCIECLYKALEDMESHVKELFEEEE